MTEQTQEFRTMVKELQGGWCELSSPPEGGAAVRFWIPGISQEAPTGDPGGQSTASLGAPVPAG